MSRIYFTSQDATAELRGSERAYMGCMICDIFCGLFRSCIDRDHTGHPSPLRNLLPENPDAWWLDNFSDSMPLCLRSASDGFYFVVDGKRHDLFHAQLNTVLDMGNDALKLMARIHGQCEIHAYTEGHNRHWLADIIKGGLAMGLYRADQGWNAVRELLDSSATGPVVMSYSVCDLFPSGSEAGWVDDNDGDDWYDLTNAERWAMAYDNLKQHADNLELRPDNWDDFRFKGFNAFQLLKAAYATEAIK